MGEILYDLTNPQKSIWDTQSFYPDTSIENIAAAAIIQDKVDFALFSKAINIFLKKHDAFRLKFIIQDGIPKQFVEPFSPINLDIVSVYSDKDVEALSNKMANHVFDINNSSLCKFQLFKYPDGHGGIVLLVHHLISDAWSCGQFISEIVDIYDSLRENKDIDINSFSYIDYIAEEATYMQSPKFEKDKSYWMEEFKTVPELATIPCMDAEKDISPSAKRKTFKIPKETIDIINEFCKSNKISLFNFFMGVYSIYLSRVNNLDDFVIGTPVLNRSNAKEKHTIGMFISVVPFRIKIDQNDTFKTFTSKIASDFFDIFRHQKYPYQTLLEDLRKTHSNIPNLYNVMLSYQNMRTNKQSAKTNYSSKWYFSNNISDDIDIHLFDINNTGSIDLAYDYKVTKYSLDDIYSLHSRILHLINQILLNPEIVIKNLEIITPDQKFDVVNKFNNTKVDYPKEKSIVQLFNEQVSKNPDGVAVSYGEQKLTYRELNRKANQLGNYLKTLGVSNGTVVPVLLKRSIDLVVSMLAVIKAGGVYLPLSTEYPIDRLNYIIKDSKAKYIIIDSSTNLFLREDLINIDIHDFSFNKYSSSLDVEITPNSLLYIIYTSGSTGNPKGVKISHRNLNNFIYSFNNLFDTISSSDHVLASTNICFDVSIFELYIALLNSASLYLYEENTITDIFKYCDSIIKNNITMLYIAPNILEDVYKILKEKKYYKLNKILVGVEPIQSNTIANFYKLNPSTRIINGYGPTETTICASAICLDQSILNNYKIIPIGKPLQNTKLYVLDKYKRFSPIGVPGELYIAGDNVSLGYLNNIDLTNKAFNKIPEITNRILYKTGDIVYWDNFGNLNFIGRNDNQIKVNGHRIELGEIEKHIYSYPNISKVVVLLNNQKKLIAYYTSNINLNTNDIRAFLQTRLPQYLVPNFFVQVKNFKLTGNGKINKKHLLSLKIDNTAKYEEPHNETEQKLVDIFKDILSLKKVGINDNFFDLGGDSLAAIKLQIEMFKCGFDFTYKDIYQYPTIKLLSDKLSKKSSTSRYTNDSNYDYTKIDNLLKNSNHDLNITNQNFKNILLTGATGFLGAHILDYLLSNTKCNIYCLVRSRENQDPQIRLLDMLHFYFGNKHDFQIFKRVFVVDGDITKKSLGINEDYISTFGHTIECVINSAAIVKHYGKKNLFLETNVSGTQNIIDFCREFNCKLVHVSTTSVSGEGFESSLPENRKLFTENNLYIGQDLSNIYVLSKFLSERLILENIINNSLDAKIIRVGNITSRFSDGHFQINVSENAFINKIHSFLQIRCVPDYLLNQPIEFTPVDLCAEAVVKLSFYKTDLNVFHLFNNNFIEFKYLLSITSKLGLDIKTVSKQEFNNLMHKLVDLKEKKDYVSGIINDFDKNGNLNYNSSVIIKNDITNNILGKLDFSWPLIDETYIKKYIFYLKSIGYL